MKPNNTQRAPGTFFEYFLYLALVIETGLAAFVYKMMAPEVGLSHARIYLAVFYFAFLGWGIYQLNRLHKKRREFLTAVEDEGLMPAMGAAATREPEPVPVAVDAIEAVQDVPTLLGLTLAQLMIVVVVFVTALMGFSWILSNMPRH